MNDCRCKGQLKREERDGRKLYRCESCGSVFLPKEDFADLFKNMVRQFKPADLEELNKLCKRRREKLVAAASDEKFKRLYFNCPECGQQMARKAFSRLSGIVIHHCSSHGVLGAQGWLEEAMDFITKGGEVLALKEELETTRAERETFRHEALKEPRPRTGGADAPIVLLIDLD
jgi:uncharacterized C2H2 Zn-finger protein